MRNRALVLGGRKTQGASGVRSLEGRDHEARGLTRSANEARDLSGPGVDWRLDCALLGLESCRALPPSFRASCAAVAAAVPPEGWS
jgi:hypothetical protein